MAVALVHHQHNVGYEDEPPDPFERFEHHRHSGGQARYERLRTTATPFAAAKHLRQLVPPTVVEPQRVLHHTCTHIPALGERHSRAHPAQHHVRDEHRHERCQAVDERRAAHAHMVIHVLHERDVVERREQTREEQALDELRFGFAVVPTPAQRCPPVFHRG